MTAKQLNKIINKLVDCYGDNELTDEKVERATRAIPYYFDDFIDNLEKQDIYVERYDEYISSKQETVSRIYFEFDAKYNAKYNYEIDEENTDFKNGHFTLIKKEKTNGK